MLWIQVDVDGLLEQDVGLELPENLFSRLSLQRVDKVRADDAMVLVNVMRIPCLGRRMTIGRASIVWPGAS